MEGLVKMKAVIRVTGVQRILTQTGNLSFVLLKCVGLLDRYFIYSDTHHYFFIGLSPTDTVLSLDVFKKGFLFASCAKVSTHVCTIQQQRRQRAETEAETEETMIMAFSTCMYSSVNANPQMSTHLLFYKQRRYVTTFKPTVTNNKCVCCVFVCRTGQYACGRWTVTAVRCTVWPGAPVTLMLWAPSPAPGNIPAAPPPYFLSHPPTQT